MGHDRLVRKIEALPEMQRLAVENLVDALTADTRHRDHDHLNQVMAAARGSWPVRMTVKDIDAVVSSMRAESYKSSKEAK